MSLANLSIEIGKMTNSISKKDYNKNLAILKLLPIKLKKLINDFTPEAKKIAKKLSQSDTCSDFHKCMIHENKVIGFIICFQDSSKTKSFMYNLKHKNFNEFRNRLKNFMYIDRVAVDTEFRKVGIASSMYEKLLEFCLELNIENLTAEINILPSRNEVSFHFHEKFDFVEIDTKKYSDDYEVSLQKRIL